jgi:MOSC domain-containing protein YiiM
MPPTITALRLSTASRASLTIVDRVDAIADTGLAGDRHAKQGSGRQVLLMTEEHLAEFALRPGDVREQVVVRGLDLYGLATGTRLRMGTAVLAIGGPCAPCARMDEVRHGLQVAIDGKRGRFASVAVAGSFAVGDAIGVEVASATHAGGAA